MAGQVGTARVELTQSLVADLEAEAADLLGLLEPLPQVDWAAPTPAVGWTVRDQVAHLAHFDEVTRTAIADPGRFLELRRQVLGSAADGDHDGHDRLQAYVDAVGPANRSRSGAQMIAWWRAEGSQLRAAALAADPDVRIPWFGPSMSLASKLTARIMETWAHGQDVVDALGLDRKPTDRLAHVARIGVLALPNSFRAHRREVPQAPVRVELTAPTGTTWAWGPQGAPDSITGDALDFCLLVTQRRHVTDTALQVSGPAATAWAEVAQAFAGPAGPGRQPGQFPQEDR